MQSSRLRSSIGEEERKKAFESRLKQLRRAEQNYEVVLKQSRIMFQELRNGPYPRNSQSDDHDWLIGKTD